jgi:hypothetical protein
MGKCKSYKGNSREPCGNETRPGYKFCDEHSTTNKGSAERLNEPINKGLDNVIDGSDIFAGAPGEDPPPLYQKEPEKSSIAVKERPKTSGAVNRAHEVVQKCFSTLDRAIDWEEDAWQKVQALPKDSWRFTDKAGTEQLRSEIVVLERAMDRTIRAATAIAKLNIDAQAVNINKVVREMIKGVVMRVFQRMGLDDQQIVQARQYLAEEFEKVSGEN